MANPTYRRSIKISPLISGPSLPFGGGLIVNASGGLLMASKITFLLVN